MKGYVYVCKMQYEGKSYYKIGRTLDLGKREAALRSANPFLKMVAKKTSSSYEKEERQIQHSLYAYHYENEWYELQDEQYNVLYTGFQFEEYAAEKKKLLWIPYPHEERVFSGKQYHVFKKQRVLKNSKKVYRWYYYWINDNGKQIQKACRGCKTRWEAENYIRNIDKPV